MYRLADEASSVRELLVEHPAIVQRIQGIPEMSMEKLFKMHFLRYLKKFSEYDPVEHSCATDEKKDYQDTVRECTSRHNRLKACGDGEYYRSRETHHETALQVECWKCGQKGHKKAECKVKVNKDQRLKEVLRGEAR